MPTRRELQHRDQSQSLPTELASCVSSVCTSQFRDVQVDHVNSLRDKNNVANQSRILELGGVLQGLAFLYSRDQLIS